MQVITIRIELPDGAVVNVETSRSNEQESVIAPNVQGPPGTVGAITTPMPSPVSADLERYWRRLSDHGRLVFGAAALIELTKGVGFTMEDIAERTGYAYSSIQSMHRLTGRTARKWVEETGTGAPIRFEKLDYRWDHAHGGLRTKYRLPSGVAEFIERQRPSTRRPTDPSNDIPE